MELIAWGGIVKDRKCLSCEAQTHSGIHRQKARYLHGYGISALHNFDFGEIFDKIDTGMDGKLSYDDLNAALQLKDIQLKEFIIQMNKEFL